MGVINAYFSNYFDFMPFIVSILGLIELIVFFSIYPFNIVFALIMFLIAGLMFKKFFDLGREEKDAMSEMDEFKQLETPKFESIRKEMLSSKEQIEMRRRAFQKMKKALK